MSPEQANQKELKAQLVMSPVHVQFFGETGVEWELEAPRAHGLSKGNILSAEKLKITLIKAGQKSTTISADEGFINSGGEIWKPETMPSLNGGDMFLRGHVVVLSTEPARLTTDWLNYKKNRSLIVTDAPVELIRGETVTQGKGLEATPDLKSVKIFDETLIIKSSEK